MKMKSRSWYFVHLALEGFFTLANDVLSRVTTMRLLGGETYCTCAGAVRGAVAAQTAARPPTREGRRPRRWSSQGAAAPHPCTAWGPYHQTAPPPPRGSRTTTLPPSLPLVHQYKIDFYYIYIWVLFPSYLVQPSLTILENKDGNGHTDIWKFPRQFCL